PHLRLPYPCIDGASPLQEQGEQLEEEGREHEREVTLGRDEVVEHPRPLDRERAEAPGAALVGELEDVHDRLPLYAQPVAERSPPRWHVVRVRRERPELLVAEAYLAERGELLGRDLDRQAALAGREEASLPREDRRVRRVLALAEEQLLDRP